MTQWIALTGYSRTGKDAAGRILVRRGFHRVAFGDLIKAELAGLVRQHYGFSAYTEEDAEKEQIRPLLEFWGDLHYDRLLTKFLRSVPPLAVNTRLCRVREAEAWKRGGGIIWHVVRPGAAARTRWEAGVMQELVDAGLVDQTIENSGTLFDLETRLDIELRRSLRAIARNDNPATDKQLLQVA